jgi:hypothetical protein
MTRPRFRSPALIVARPENRVGIQGLACNSGPFLAPGISIFRGGREQGRHAVAVES